MVDAILFHHHALAQTRRQQIGAVPLSPREPWRVRWSLAISDS